MKYNTKGGDNAKQDQEQLKKRSEILFAITPSHKVCDLCGHAFEHF
jgi:hypothetical protein